MRLWLPTIVAMAMVDGCQGNLMMVAMEICLGRQGDMSWLSGRYVLVAVTPGVVC